MFKKERGTSSDEIHCESHHLRSEYNAVKTLIADEGEKISSLQNDTFKSIIEQVQNLHQFVRGPREQVNDAEALWSITTSLLTGVKLLTNNGVTPSDFISGLLSTFSEHDGHRNAEGAGNLIRWKDVGDEVSHFMRTCYGFRTMTGPMNLQPKQKVTVRRRKRKRVEYDVPKTAEDEPAEKRETIKGMKAIFDILRKKRITKLENLVLNRDSFARTVENIFALSFLVKDGRAEIEVDENGCHLVHARNSPSASEVASGDAVYRHFVFRFDFQDWLLMKTSVAEGEELVVC